MLKLITLNCFQNNCDWRPTGNSFAIPVEYLTTNRKDVYSSRAWSKCISVALLTEMTRGWRYSWHWIPAGLYYKYKTDVSADYSEFCLLKYTFLLIQHPRFWIVFNNKADLEKQTMQKQIIILWFILHVYRTGQR